MTQPAQCLFNQAGWLGVIAGILLATYPIITRAQIVPDGTLETQAIPLTPGACAGIGGTCGITNGSTRGSNLFHSFRQFSLPNRDVAAFITDPSIQNVIVRVTGIGQPFISNINGTIATTDSTVSNINPTNFFLINPNGIIFGPNASLLIGGSFLATTANRMQFQDGTVLSTTDPSPLLTISVPIGLQMGQTPGEIRMQRSVLAAGTFDDFADFALVGGDVTLNESFVSAPGRRIELSGVATGYIGLSVNRNNLSLSISDTVERADILLNKSAVLVFAENGGSIAINARNIGLTERSFVDAGIAPGSGSVASQAGNITINASGSLTLRQRSLLRNSVFPGATGNSGDINITANSLQITDGSQIADGIFGRGNAGSIALLVKDTISIDGASGNFPSGLLAAIATGAIGNAGNIQITAKALSLTNGGQVQNPVAPNGNGNAGDISINVSDTLFIDGVGGNQLRSGIFSNLEFAGVGKGGTIRIVAKSLQVTNGGGLIVSTDGRGNAGNIIIQAHESVLLDGGSNEFNSSAISGVGTDAVGKGGNISITTRFFSATNGAFLQASTDGQGDAGNITVKADNNVSLNGIGSNEVSSGIFTNVGTGAVGRGGDIYINTGTLLVNESAELLSLTRGQGSAGNIVIQAREQVSFGVSSAVFSTVESDAVGRGGDIYINTGSLFVNGSASLQSLTRGQGNAGNIVIGARKQVSFSGISRDGFSSGAFSAVDVGAIGDGGFININTPSLSITNSAVLSAETIGKGNAGNIFVTANTIEMNDGQIRTSTASGNRAGNILLNVNDRLTLSGSNTGLFASTAAGSSGNGGSIFVDPRTVLIQDGATIAVNSQGSGTGGNITIQAGKLELRDRGSITAETASAQGGDIKLDVQDLLLLRRNSLISATAGTAQDFGNGGNIRIKAPFIIGVSGENSDITANAFRGNGGEITIDTNAIFGLQYRPQLTPFSDITASSQFGLSGTVAINTLNVDPNRGLVALPVNLTDPSQQISQDCRPGSKTSASSFVATGRGGIPLSPEEPLESRAIVTQWVPLPEEVGKMRSQGNKAGGETIQNPKLRIQNPIIEAQGWIVDANGTVELVAQTPHSTAWYIWPACESVSNY